MLGATARPRALPSWLHGRPAFNRAHSAGPRRLVLISFTALCAVGVVVAVSLQGSTPPAPSRDARMKPVDPLPGGLRSTPEQDALANVAQTAHAEAAMRRGVSYSPPMAPSQRVQPGLAAAESEPPAEPAPAPRPAPSPVVRAPAQQAPAALLASFPVQLPPPVATRAVETAPPPRAIPVQANPAHDAVQAQQQQAYQRAVDDLYRQWGGRPPRTDVILPPTERDAGAGDDNPVPRSAYSTPRAREAAPPVTEAVAARPAAGRVLVPAGRGIYAHPVLAVNSDASSPVVLQADSGPIAGDRMIGSFSRENERLVIRISSVQHAGESIPVEGIVIAPDTMEAAVASSVDRHYAERYVLPAAAAFVQGLGQALATTSNTAAVLSPFGGVTTSTNLNLRQQLGVAAGVAGAQVGQTLREAAPKGPTVSLEKDVSVGVMFLSNVTARGGQ